VITKATFSLSAKERNLKMLRDTFSLLKMKFRSLISTALSPFTLGKGGHGSPSFIIYSFSVILLVEDGVFNKSSLKLYLLCTHPFF
jgi:hypothetical protein